MIAARIDFEGKTLGYIGLGGVLDEFVPGKNDMVPTFEFGDPNRALAFLHSAANVGVVAVRSEGVSCIVVGDESMTFEGGTGGYFEELLRGAEASGADVVVRESDRPLICFEAERLAGRIYAEELARRAYSEMDIERAR